MKRLLISAFVCMGLTLEAMNNLPPLIRGTLQLKNNLKEPVSYKLNLTLNGIDPETQTKMINTPVSTQGTIPAQSVRKINSGNSFGGNDIWSVPVEITLQRQNQPAERFVLVEDILGTHILTLLPSGQLSLSKADDADKEAAEKIAAQGPSTVSVSMGSFSPQTMSSVPAREAKRAGRPQQKPSINARDEHGRTMLMNAAADNKMMDVRTLLEHGADANMQDQDGNTALILAVKQGGINIVSILIDGHAAVDLEDNNGNTALMHAVKTGNFISANALIKAGADINHQNSAGETPYLEAIKKNSPPLLSVFPKQTERNIPAYAPSHPQGHKRSVTFAQPQQTSSRSSFAQPNVADINATDNTGKTQLMNAILKSGISISGFSVTGAHNPHGSVTGIEFTDSGVVFGQGAQVSPGKTTAKAMPEINRLLQAGADVNKQDNDGNTALMFAAQKDFLDVVRALIDKGADLMKRNNAGDTALSIAEERNNQAMVNLLEKLERESQDFR